MRFKLCLSLSSLHNRKLPMSYQYELSSFIYKTIANGDKLYADWLHQNGFETQGKQFRLFTFSNFDIPKYAINKTDERLIIQSEEVSFEIAFLPEKSTEEFVKGIFANQHFSIGDKISKVDFSIKSIELIAEPNYTMPFEGKTLSPLCVALKNENDKIDYISPEHPEFIKQLKSNLLTKYEAFYGKTLTSETFFAWETKSKPHPKLIKIKTDTPQQTKVKGYLFEFKLFTSPELMKIAHNCGLGEKNSMGFGMIGGGRRAEPRREI